jgi:hypothetical protein
MFGLPSACGSHPTTRSSFKYEMAWTVVPQLGSMYSPKVKKMGAPHSLSANMRSSSQMGATSSQWRRLGTSLHLRLYTLVVRLARRQCWVSRARFLCDVDSGHVCGGARSSSLLGLRFALQNKSAICVRTRQVNLAAVRAVNLASFLTFVCLEDSPALTKTWRVGYYETKEYGPIKPLFCSKYSCILNAGGCVRVV